MTGRQTLSDPDRIERKACLFWAQPPHFALMVGEKFEIWTLNLVQERERKWGNLKLGERQTDSDQKRRSKLTSSSKNDLEKLKIPGPVSSPDRHHHQTLLCALKCEWSIEMMQVKELCAEYLIARDTHLSQAVMRQLCSCFETSALIWSRRGSSSASQVQRSISSFCIFRKKKKKSFLQDWKLKWTPFPMEVTNSDRFPTL